MSALTAGTVLSLRIEDVVYRGQGLARHEGRVVFVRGVAPGERVRARVTAVKRSYATADCVAVEDASPDRIPCCTLLPDGTPVPGCVYGHLAYEAEVAAKARQLAGFLRRLPGASGEVGTTASPLPLHYRNKIVVHAQGARRGGRAARLGYVGDDNRHVLDLPACPLAREPINAALGALRERLLGGLRDGQRVTLRWTAADAVVYWTDAAPAAAPPLTEASPVGPLAVSRDGFYQVNSEVGEALVRQVVEWFRATCSDGSRDVLDLYCGVGVFALACARAGAGRAHGVESGCAAVQLARHNARRLGLDATFGCARAADAAGAGFPGIDLSRATVVVDPPRQGLEPPVLRALIEGAPPDILYVSCDPATLTRDLRALTAARYGLAGVRLLDMFPRTAHFESAVWLRRVRR